MRNYRRNVYSRNRLSERYTTRRRLSEAQISLTPDEIWGRADFDLRKANKRSQDAEKARIKAQQDAEIFERNKKLAQKYYDIIDTQDASDAIDSLFELLVPASGKAETVAGELIRALCKIGHRWNNDGDNWLFGYGYETCGEAVSYLMDNYDSLDSFLEDWRREWEDRNDSIIYDYFYYEKSFDKTYDAKLEKLYKIAMEYLKKHPEAFTTPNDIDMLKTGVVYDELTFDYDWQLDRDLINLYDDGHISEEDLLDELFGWSINDDVRPFIEMDEVMVEGVTLDTINTIRDIMDSTDQGHTVYESWISEHGDPYEEDEEEYDEEEDDDEDEEDNEDEE